MRKSLAFLAFAFALLQPLFAQTTRTFKPIKQGEEAQETLPLARADLESLLQDIVSSWNTDHFGEYLSDDFYDRERLLRAINDKVPKDARLRMLALQDVRLLEQKEEEEETSYIVSASVRTSLEFEDPNEGFQSLEGENELILKISVAK